MPGTFSTAPASPGDRVTYRVETREGTFDDWVAGDPEREMVTFSWNGSRVLRDASGVARVTELLAFEELVRTQQGGWVRSAGSAYVDVATGQGVAHAQSDAESSVNPTVQVGPADVLPVEWAAEYELLALERDGPTETDGGLPCGAIHALQGSPHELGAPVRLFRECSAGPRMESTLIGPQEFVAKKAARWGDLNLVMFDVVPPDESLFKQAGPWNKVPVRVWLAAQIPYPVRMEVGDWRNPGTFYVIRLSDLERGQGVLGSGLVAPTDVTPPLNHAARKPFGPDEGGATHAFPLSAAYDRAMADSGPGTLGGFHDAHPAAYVEAAGYRFISNATGQHHEWRIFATDGADRFAVDSTMALPPARRGIQALLPAAGAEAVYERRTSPDDRGYAMVLLADTPAPPDLVPEHMPTVASLWARWGDYASPMFAGKEPNAWGFRLAHFHPKGAEPRVAWASWGGHYEVLASSGDGFPGDAPASSAAVSILEYGSNAAFAKEGSDMFLESRYESSVRPVGVAEPDALPQLAGEPSPGPNLATAGRWTLPSPALVAGAGFVGLLAGAVYLAWPHLKTGALAGLFSRLERPAALRHPTRAQIHQLVAAEPGLHTQEISRRLQLPRTTTDHHLRKLVSVGLLSEHAAGGQADYYVAGSVDRRIMDARAILHHEGARSVLANIASRAGICASDVASALSLDPGTVSYHVKRLRGAGLVTAEREWRTLRLAATDLGRAALASAS